MEKFNPPPRITLRDREYAIQHPRFILIKSIKHAKGTLISKYKITYYKRKKRITQNVIGQSTTTQGEYVDTQIEKLIRNAFQDAIIRFKEANGLSYSTNIIAEHIKTRIIYYEQGTPTNKRLTQTMITNSIQEEIKNYVSEDEEDIKPKQKPLENKKSIQQKLIRKDGMTQEEYEELKKLIR